jgi:hypothetical protein
MLAAAASSPPRRAAGMNEMETLQVDSEVFKQGPFRVRTTYAHDRAIRLLGTIQSGGMEVVERLKDNRSNFVARIRFEGDDLVVKIPHARNRRLYERFLTWFRPGEAFRRYRSMELLARLGFRGLEPVLAAERRAYGMAVCNLLVYRYAHGRPAGTGHERLLVEELVRFYRHGYTRRDPKPSNFLIVDGRPFFIDFRLNQPLLFGKLRVYQEFHQFFRRMPQARAFFDDTGYRGPWFSLAGRLGAVWDWFNQRRKAVRAAIKRRAGRRSGPAGNTPANP